MIYIGIDPGKDGAIAAISSGAIPQVFITPTVLTGKGGKRNYDERMMGKIFYQLIKSYPDCEFVTIEKQQAMPGQGRTSMFSIGEGGGLWSIIAAGRLFPSIDLRRSERARVAHDGKAEALLIAMYGRRLDKGETK